MVLVLCPHPSPTAALWHAGNADVLELAVAHSGPSTGNHRIIPVLSSALGGARRAEEPFFNDKKDSF